MSEPRNQRADRLIAVGAIIVAALLLGFGLRYVFAPRHAPPGQRSLTVLSAGNLDEVRVSFNGARGRTRILALLSPT